MEEKKLILRIKKYKSETAVLSVRLPQDLIKDLDKIAEKTGRTRNDIMQKCLEFSIENIVIEKI